ncbi:phospholipase A1 PLIP1, chloroplastic [Rutidosis leptorrhynchoides]|uniref:phospholipase A1 PLIP1, chloroplastic n=1 Tax=Rutidosis leptorrhynchoides TaxID=125765 RepID=UPI003A99ABF0
MDDSKTVEGSSVSTSSCPSFGCDNSSNSNEKHVEAVKTSRSPDEIAASDSVERSKIDSCVASSICNNGSETNASCNMFDSFPSKKGDGSILEDSKACADLTSSNVNLSFESMLCADGNDDIVSGQAHESSNVSKSSIEPTQCIEPDVGEYHGSNGSSSNHVARVNTNDVGLAQSAQGHLKEKLILMPMMVYGTMTVSSQPTTPKTDGSVTVHRRNVLNRSISGQNLRQRAMIRRAYSDNNMCYSANRVQASVNQPKLKNSRSMGIFEFNIPSFITPNSLKKSLFDQETSFDTNMETDERDETADVNDIEMEKEDKKKANWIERLMEIRSRWVQKQTNEIDGDNDEEKECVEDGTCEVDYSDDEDDVIINQDTFSELLKNVSWSDTKHFSQLAFLCNMAYVIPEIEEDDLRRYYDLKFVTSSLEKKALAEAIARDSVRVPLTTLATNQMPEKRIKRTSAYEIAASAATYVQSQAGGLISRETEQKRKEDDDVSVGRGDTNNHPLVKTDSSNRIYKSEMAAYMAASTMTAVVAAPEKEKQEAARDLQSLHSSPCEWFICDDSSIYTRCFVIQGSDSVASWQANLFFEPTKFEGTGVLVHRGIYEAAKGISEQFMPHILEHLNRYGERAKLQFTGHSLGGSLSLLVNLMLLTRNVVKPSALRPVVTFGSPFVFCNGQKILDHLGLDENHVHCVMMHRDIVPRAFSCNYPNHVAQLLKRLCGTFRSHPCLNRSSLLYTPLGKMFILQPDEKSSPHHPLLPPGSALYAMENTHRGPTKAAIRTFLNSPHPIETLQHPTAYGSDGTILRDHDSSNYLKAVNGIIRQHTKTFIRKPREQKNLLWPLLTSQSPHYWSQETKLKEKKLSVMDQKRLITTEVV